jgi:Multicopper oxidase
MGPSVAREPRNRGPYRPSDTFGLPLSGLCPSLGSTARRSRTDGRPRRLEKEWRHDEHAENQQRRRYIERPENRLPAAMDGTESVQRLVPPGGRFEYRVELPDAGTLWYHSHANETVQIERGVLRQNAICV